MEIPEKLMMLEMQVIDTSDERLMVINAVVIIVL